MHKNVSALPRSASPFHLGELAERPRLLPVREASDVVVVGGGPAGVTAAVAAARAGASVRLLEVHGALGGVWTAGLLSHLIDWKNKQGLMAEIVRRLDDYDGRASPGGVYDAEVMKVVLDEMCLESGVRVQTHTRVVDSQVTDGRLTHVITESKSGREAWAGRCFVDASGDGDLAALAGCRFDVGRPENGQCQPMSLMAVVAGLNRETVRPFVVGEPGEPGDPKARLLQAIRDAGVEPSYGKPTLFRVHDDLYALMANHEYAVSATDAQAISDATRRARAEVFTIVRGLRESGGPWATLRLVATGGQIGVREGRRIHGRYRVTVDDLIEGRRHEDAVCRATFCVDIHATDPTKGRAYGAEGVNTTEYDIPLRALIAADVQGLLMAGRCISGDFLAHGSYRVTGNAVAMGQAAGVAAAHAARVGVMPHELDGAEHLAASRP